VQPCDGDDWGMILFFWDARWSALTRERWDANRSAVLALPSRFRQPMVGSVQLLLLRLEGCFSAPLLPNTKQRADFSKLPRPGARKTQSRAEIRATGSYLIERKTPTSRSHEVQAKACQTNARL
jgi:hypothetical protein